MVESLSQYGGVFAYNIMDLTAAVKFIIITLISYCLNGMKYCPYLVQNTIITFYDDGFRMMQGGDGIEESIP